MLRRWIVLALAVMPLPAGSVLAKEPSPRIAATAPARTAPTLTGKDRQKACAAEWRALSDSEKAAQGPRWPPFYSRCVKRLKAQRT